MTEARGAEPQCSEAEEVRVRLNENGRVILPAAMRQGLGAKNGDLLILRLIQNDGHEPEIRVVPARRRLQAAIADICPHVPSGVNAAEELMRDRREEAARASALEAALEAAGE